MEEGLKTADPHDFSAYTGWTGVSSTCVNDLPPFVMLSCEESSLTVHYFAGISLLYLQLHQVSGETSDLQRALDYVKRSMRILNSRKVSFLCGDAGPLAVGAVIHHKLGNSADSKDCLSRWVPLTCSSLSLQRGALFGCMYCKVGNTCLGRQQFCFNCLEKKNAAVFLSSLLLLILNCIRAETINRID